jgi:hypothetical protein
MDNKTTGESPSSDFPPKLEFENAADATGL